jgi:hypothetical protein
MRSLNYNRWVYILFLIGMISILGCINNTKVASIKNYIVVDSLRIDFNDDSKIETIKILNNKDSFHFSIFSNTDSLVLLNKNILFSKGELGKESEYIYLSYNDSVLIITQEFGSARPEGWYLAYISFRDNYYVIDSIEKKSKIWNHDNRKNTLEIESQVEIINCLLEDCNLINEFNKF